MTDLLTRVEVIQKRFIVVLTDVSGYTAHIPPAEIPGILLATSAGGQTLDHWHGCPMRAVVPSRRGWHWVKWLTEIEITNL